jgi:hypothetical protein
MAPKPKTQIFRGRRDHPVLTHHGIALPITKLREAKAVEFLRVRIDFPIRVDRTEWERHECTGWDGHAVGEPERAKGEA